MVKLITLPGYAPSPLMDFSQINQAFENQRQQANMQAKLAAAEKQQLEQQRQFNAGHVLDQNRDARAGAAEGRAAALAPSQLQEAEFDAKLKQKNYNAPPPDPNKYMSENGRIFRIGREGNAQDIGGSPKPDPMAAREAQARALGLQPGSPEDITYRLNGKLPADFYKNAAQKRLREESAPRITDGLRNLANIASSGDGAKYDDVSFSNSVGPLQGSNPDSMLSGAGANIARFGGEIANVVQRGRTAPTEIRSDINGATLALAAAIKPLVRGPGEGAWTDADQAQLNMIVGDLGTASDKQELNRRLEAVRDRVKANFGLDINFQAGGKAQGRAPGAPAAPGGGDVLGEARSAIARGANKAAVIERLRQRGIDPGGL